MDTYLNESDTLQAIAINGGYTEVPLKFKKSKLRGSMGKPVGLGNSPQVNHSLLGDFKLPSLFRRHDRGSQGSVSFKRDHNDVPELIVPNSDDDEILDVDQEPAYMRIMQASNAIFKEQITVAVAQLFPHLDITQECTMILSNFLQDTLVWCILESGRQADRDSSNNILSCHMQGALKKLLQTSKDPHHNTNTDTYSASTSPYSTPSITPEQTPTVTPSSSFGNFSEISTNPPSPSLGSDFASSLSRDPPPLESIITKRLFVQTPHNATPDAHTAQTNTFLLIDHALARFETMVCDAATFRWGEPTCTDGVQMWTKPVKGSVVNMKSSAEIDRNAREVFSVIMDFDNQKKWNNVLFEYKVIDVLDKHTLVAYQRYQSNRCLLKSERDFCTAVHWLEKDGTYTLIAQSVEHEKCPVAKGITRAKMNSSGYRVEPVGEGRCRVTYCVEVDLVFVPSIVASLMQRQLNLIPRLRSYLTGHKFLPSPSPSPPPSPSLSPNPSLYSIARSPSLSSVAPSSSSSRSTPSSSPAPSPHIPTLLELRLSNILEKEKEKEKDNSEKDLNEVKQLNGKENAEGKFALDSPTM